MKCVVCGKSIHEAALFRVNEKGVKGIWACKPHTSLYHAPIDPIVEEIADLVSGAAFNGGKT